MFSFIASRLASSGLALALLLVAGSARAQFEECVVPTNVPEAVFNTIVDEAGFEFGSVSGKVCKSIANRAGSTCKAQVKLQEKCFRKALDSNYQIAVKQCHQLGSKQEKKDCKSDAKDDRKDGKEEVKDDAKSALDACKDELESAIEDACENGIES